MTAQTATIQIQYVNQPREAHWSHGNVKDVNKQLWSVHKDRLGYFQANEVCEIVYETTGKYPEIIGKGGQMFPSQPAQPQPGTAAPNQASGPPRNANWPGPPKQPVTTLTYEKPAEPPTPPILSNILATAVEAGLIKEPSDLVAWAYHVRQAVDNYHSPGIPGQPASPAHQARSDIDSQYGNQHPNMTDIPTGESAFPPGHPEDPGPFGG